MIAARHRPIRHDARAGTYRARGHGSSRAFDLKVSCAYSLHAARPAAGRATLAGARGLARHITSSAAAMAAARRHAKAIPRPKLEEAAFSHEMPHLPSPPKIIAFYSPAGYRHFTRREVPFTFSPLDERDRE